MRVVVLIDGEHHPSAVRSALQRLRGDGYDVVAAAFCGGAEKVRPERLADAIAIEVIVAATPDRVVATGKRTGKTAVASALARRAASRGFSPLIVAVGRGGPDPPNVIEAGRSFDAATLMALADAGDHAASDYIEDAVTSGVTTIGCFRVGGGLGGATVHSNVEAAAHLAQERPEDLIILEGSGASVPEVAAHAGVLCLPGSITAAEVAGWLNPYRLLMADVAVVTMEPPAPDTVAAIISTAPDLHLAQTRFRPVPVSPIVGQRVFLCTTAGIEAGAQIASRLADEAQCEVVGMTHRLADRTSLDQDLAEAPEHDVVVSELKGAAVDVVARWADGHDRPFVVLDNVVEGDGFDEALDRAIDLAVERA